MHCALDAGSPTRANSYPARMPIRMLDPATRRDIIAH